MSLHLEQGPFRLDLAPEHGGSVLGFTYKTHDILRPARHEIPQNWSAKDFGAFPLVPFCSRITNGRFEGAHHKVQLPANMPPERHAIHGFGWQSAWTITESGPAMAELSHVYGGAVWPWAYTARQRFELSAQGLALTLSLTNQSDTMMPAGLGWHPYFPRGDAYLKAATTGIWLDRDERSAPAPAHADLNGGRWVKDLDLDAAFEISEPVQSIHWPEINLTIKSDPVFGKLVVYVPPGRDYFCVEPVTHAPDAVNSTLPREATGLRQLAPGETLSGTIGLLVSEPVEPWPAMRDRVL